MSQKSYDGKPCLYLIATPIGNLEDITYRAIKVLQEVEVIFCEDTRVTRQLLNHYQIKKKLIASHQYNEIENSDKLLEYLKNGLSVGLVTDRGTPIISDPGYDLVQSAIHNGYNVVAIPGAAAFLCALITSGIPAQPFTFYGFLNSKQSRRRKELEDLKRVSNALIFYEAPHRLLETLEDMYNILGNRTCSISREISKKFEEIYRGKIDQLVKEMKDVKGELVIVLEGATLQNSYDNLTIIEHVNLYIKEGMEVKSAIKIVAKERKLSKNDVYMEYHK